MSDLRPHGVDIQIGDETLRLLFPLAVIDEIQATCNLGIFDAMQAIVRASNMDLRHETIETFENLLSVVINFNNPEYLVTADDVGALVDINQYKEFSLALLEAFGLSMPEKDEDDDEDDEDSVKKKTVV